MQQNCNTEKSKKKGSLKFIKIFFVKMYFGISFSQFLHKKTYEKLRNFILNQLKIRENSRLIAIKILVLQKKLLEI